ncbi:alcohol oxidase [Diaporthe amygdali]|uniref:alcohol oxidase n=1 Tax=Phomopsis amygdali TaxID=1214568 RepID=UPI0022FDD516|nr:alcohol oxidase [Diaporthe amygdali]KAJ0120794.1 alcohol oxidase [Diaporthe amygdali]
MSQEFGIFPAVCRLLALAPLLVTGAHGLQYRSTNKTEFDYIVIGSGPGGGPLASNLARAGFETLLVEAGDDEFADPSSNVIDYFVTTGIHDNLHWDFYVKHYDDLEQDLRYAHLVWRKPDGDLWVGPGGSQPEGSVVLGVNYPRGAVLGGSSIINAGAVFLPSDSDWNYIAEITNDTTWNAEHTRDLFIKLENNTYLPRGTAGHGFDGYLQTAIGDGTQYTSGQQAVDVLKAQISELGKDPNQLEELITADPNYEDPSRDTTEGLWALPFHANKTFGRSSARDRIISTVNENFPLYLQLNSYATRILFGKSNSTSTPKAVGVEFLEGKSVYKGDPRWTASNQGTLKSVSARKEVIVSAGSFNTPQLLLLSGIGNATHLAEHNISVVVDLPGVGTNMQDNEEMAVTGLAAENFTYAPRDGLTSSNCTYGATFPDPCYDAWLQGKGPYTNPGPNSNILTLKTAHSPDGERDVIAFSGSFAFRGFWPATPGQTWTEPPNTWGIHSVRMHPQNRAGYVKLRSSDPTEMPEINFRYFTEGSETDIEAIKDFVAWGRRALQRVEGPTGPVNITSPPCPTGYTANGTCSDAQADEQFIRDNTFGHHVTSTCPIGADDDKLAVLNSNFQVRGVEGLRVVDASAFPRIPGAFPVIATFILSEKASQAILGGK